MPPKQPLRSCTIEIDMHDCRVSPKKCGEIIHHNRIDRDIGIETAASAAGLQDIPQRVTVLTQCKQTRRIGHAGEINAQHPAHDRPELIAWMCVVLAGTQRGDTWHAAQNEAMRGRVFQRRKTVRQ